MTSLIKLSDSNQKAGQFRSVHRKYPCFVLIFPHCSLRDGRSIRTVSALLLQLVQTSVHDTRIEAERIEKARHQQQALRRQDSINGDDQNPQNLLDEKDEEEIRLYQNALDAPTKAAKTIILFLSQRSGKSKTSKNNNEAEYRAIFDNLISDLLVVLFWPEWPAAALVLNIVCKFMVSLVDDHVIRTLTTILVICGFNDSLLRWMTSSNWHSRTITRPKPLHWIIWVLSRDDLGLILSSMTMAKRFLV